MKIAKITNTFGNTRWRVTYQLGGKQHRMFFRSSEDAKKFTKSKESEVERNGSAWLHVPANDRAELLQVLQRARQGNYRPLDALDYFEKHKKPGDVVVVTVAQAAEQCIESKKRQNLRAKYLKALRSNFNKFGTTFGDRAIREVGVAEVENWLNSHGWAPGTRKSYRVDLQTLFSFAVGRGWIDKNPVSAVPRPMLDDKPPGILTVEQAKELMKVCRERDPGMCGFFALALFAGIRPSQLLRMRPENVNLDEKVVRAVGWQTKSRQNRLVDLSDNCVAWCRIGMELPPTNWRKRFDKVRLVAGIDDWPPDGMRHSFASYHLAAHSSADKTAAQMGHRSTEMIFQHYRELVPKKEAEKFWQIVPEDTKPSAKLADHPPAKTVVAPRMKRSVRNDLQPEPRP